MSIDPLTVDYGSVRGSEIDQRELRAGELEHGMASRGGFVPQREVAVLVTTDHDLAAAFEAKPSNLSGILAAQYRDSNLHSTSSLVPHARGGSPSTPLWPAESGAPTLNSADIAIVDV